MRLPWVLAATLAAAALHWRCVGTPLPGLTPWDENGVDHERAGQYEAKDADEPALRVATWNLKRLGHGGKRLDRIAPIIEGFDVVALQEVMSPDAVAELLALLPGWKAEISPHAVGRGRYEEWYAILYRPERVAVERSFLMDDTHDAFEREPLVTCMRARSFDFCLVVIHVIFGRQTRARDAEIQALGKQVIALREDSTEKDWIVLGDFNRMPTAPGWDVLLGAGWAFATETTIATSLGKGGYRNAYDHILVDPEHTRELDAPAQRVDFVALACADDFDTCSVEVSDHAPVFATFQTHGPDDD